MGKYGHHWSSWCGKNGIFKRIKCYAQENEYKFDAGCGIWGKFTKTQSSTPKVKTDEV